MKKIFLTSIVLFALLFSSGNSFGKGCYAHIIYGTLLNYGFHDPTGVTLTLNLDTIYDYNAIINDTLKFGEGGDPMLCWGYDQNFFINDTGFYSFNFSTAETMIIFINLHVSRASAILSTTSISNPDLFQIYPTLSSGIFRIKTSADYHPKKIIVTDGEGRIVYTSATNFSEINLTDFATGIYFYAVEDEWQKVYRGKIIRN